MNLQPYPKYHSLSNHHSNHSSDYFNALPDGWQLLPNIAIFTERKTRGTEKEETLSISAIRGIVKSSDYENRKDRTSDDKSQYLLVKEGDLAYNTMLMWDGAVGHSSFRGIVSPAYTVLRSKMKINSKYFHYQMRTEFYKNYSRRFSYGIVDARLRLYYVHFKRMYSIVPPLEVQNSIVEYLDKKNNEIDKFIRNKEKLIELLEEQRKEMIDNSFNNFAKIDTNKKPLKYLVRLISDQTNKLSDKETYLALENIESWTGKIDLTIGQSEFESTVKKFRPTDVLFSKLRPYLAKVIIPDFLGVCVSEILVLRPSKLIDKEFLFYKLISKRFIDLVDSSTYGSKMPRASYAFIGKIEIEYPIEIGAQRMIVQEIKLKEIQTEKLKNKYRKEISAIKEYREALITELVSGKRRVPQTRMS